MSEMLKLDWSQAEVADSKLTVSLDGSPAKQWRGSFETAAVLLSRDRLSIALSKNGAIAVSPVQPGDEETIRDLVEGCVLQANSTVTDEDDLFGIATPEQDAAQGDDGAPSAEPDPDQELTGRFRAFADGQDGDDRQDEQDPL